MKLAVYLLRMFGLENTMEQERGRRFHLELNSVEDFAALCAIIRGENNTAETQARINALAATINQSSNPLETALDQQKDK